MSNNKYEEFDQNRPPTNPSENMQLFPEASPNLQNQPPPNVYPGYEPQQNVYAANPYPLPQQQAQMAPIVQHQMPVPLSYGIPIEVRQQSSPFSSLLAHYSLSANGSGLTLQ